MTNAMKVDTLIKVRRVLSEVAQRAVSAQNPIQNGTQQRPHVPSAVPSTSHSPVVPTGTSLLQTTNLKPVHANIIPKVDSSRASLSSSSAITASNAQPPSPVQTISRSARAREGEGKGGWFDQKVNTGVYVTGLPDDVTEEELAEVGPLVHKVIVDAVCLWK